MRRRFELPRWRLSTAVVVALAVLVVPAALALGGDALVTVGSPQGPQADHEGTQVNSFAQNKQNEPWVAVNPVQTDIVAAGSNDEIDLELCNAGDPSTCPFTAGVGVSGIYFSTDSARSWMQPTYTGWSARHCLGPDPCDPQVGPIGTLPNYYEAKLVADGDPALAWGPVPDGSGGFSWDRQRLYYVNLTSNLEGGPASRTTFRGAEAIAVSRLDSDQLGAAMAGDNGAWKAPVIVSRQNSALFSDKEAVYVDNVETSPYFGRAYVCNVAFRGAAGSEPVMVAVSADGGDTWRQRQISAATNNNQTGGRQGCSIRTGSDGVVYVFWEGTDIKTGQSVVFLARSFDGGSTFERPRSIVSLVDCGLPDPATGRLSFDGIAGARTDSFPLVDIANGRPYGAGTPSDELVVTYCDGPTTMSDAPERAAVIWSTDGGANWSDPVDAAPAGDRPDFPAIAISPSGGDVYVTYTNFTVPWQDNVTAERPAQGVVLRASVGADGAPGAFGELYRGPTGDARGSSQNGLTAGFLGDYNYAWATDDYAVAVWNDVRNTNACDAIQDYRGAFVEAVTSGRAQPIEEGDESDLGAGDTGNKGNGKGKDAKPGAGPTLPTPPAVNTACLGTNFGNSDIYSFSTAGS